MVASARGYTRGSYFYYPEQKSEQMYLDRNREYYYEAYLGDYGGNYHLSLGLFAHRTKHANSEISNAMNEKQRISISSEIKPNIQVS